MKNLILIFILFAGAAFSAVAQDVIVKKNGEEINAKVSEVSTANVKYKRSSNLNGPDYNLDASEIFMIKYANGSKDVFSINEAGKIRINSVELEVVKTEEVKQTTTVPTESKTSKYKEKAEVKLPQAKPEPPITVAEEKVPEPEKRIFTSRWKDPKDADYEDLPSLEAGETLYKGIVKFNTTKEAWACFILSDDAKWIHSVKLYLLQSGSKRSVQLGGSFPVSSGSTDLGAIGFFIKNLVFSGDEANGTVSYATEDSSSGSYFDRKTIDYGSSNVSFQIIKKQ